MALFHPYRPGEETGEGPTPAREGSSVFGTGKGARTAASPAPPPAVLTHTSRCPSCEITIHTHGTPPPSVCPYCRHALVQDAVNQPLANAVPPPPDAEVAERRRALYHRPHGFFVTIIALVAIFLLAWAVYGQQQGISKNFYYQPFGAV